MRVLMVSKACIVGLYQSKLEGIGKAPDLEFGVLMPPSWDDRAGSLKYEPLYTEGYETWIDPIRFNGSYHFHYYPSLAQRVREFQPDLIHFDEEPYNLATWHGLQVARRFRSKFLFFSWQNLFRTYPIPFRWMEHSVLSQADFGIMGNQAALEVFRSKGYTGPAAVLPQFGIAADAFFQKSAVTDSSPVQIGFAGRLIADKGIDLLIEALYSIRHLDWELLIAGQGPEQPELEEMVATRQLTSRVQFLGPLPSSEMPQLLSRLEILVLPSRTRPNWKEQFGRILIEAMASEVVVIGSNSGEIPHVIGQHGLVFEEENMAQLAHQLTELILDHDKRRALGREARLYAIERFSQEKIAQQTVEIYRQVLSKKS